MDQEPLAVPALPRPPALAGGGATGRWGLPPEAGADIQGLVVSPFEHAPETAALFLELQPGSGGAWLAALLDAGLITSGSGKVPCCGALALTWSGLRRMGLAPEVLATFPAPFQEGMTDTDRARRLGDDNPVMLAGGVLQWSGNVAWERHLQSPADPPPVQTRQSVHALLLLYGPDRAAVDVLVDKAVATLALHGVANFLLDLSLYSGAEPSHDAPPHEHFGFADGVSQPLPYSAPLLPDPLHGIPVGEVLMGYMNRHAEIAPGPVVLTGAAPGVLQVTGPGVSNLGLNGSYLVVRQLHQDVAAFRRSMEDAAATLNDPTLDAGWLAERVIGRQRDGNVLLPGSSLPAAAGQADNNFGYFAKDRAGLGCPVGSHVRRANPRDGLAPDAASRLDVLHAANNHRILRRGRKYGAPLPQGAPDDGAPRGLLFLCLQADIERQFEFIQQTWVLNPVFGDLMQQTDPLLGPPGAFTIPADPLRRVVQVKTFVQLAGGEYFFLPSMRALSFLGALPPV